MGLLEGIRPGHLEDEPLERQLEYWMRQLEPRRDALSKLAELGCEVVIDCYFAIANTELLELRAPMLKVLGGLGVSVDIHFCADGSSIGRDVAG